METALTCRRVTCREAWDSAEWPKIQAEYGADVRYPDLSPEPDWDLYLKLEAQRVLRCVGLFDGPRLVGFANYIVTQLPHFAGKRLASTESLWVDLDYRGRGAGRQLLGALQAFAREDGCYGIYLGAKVGSRAEKVLASFATPMNTLFWVKL